MIRDSKNWSISKKNNLKITEQLTFWSSRIDSLKYLQMVYSTKCCTYIFQQIATHVVHSFFDTAAHVVHLFSALVTYAVHLFSLVLTYAVHLFTFSLVVGDKKNQFFSLQHPSATHQCPHKNSAQSVQPFGRLYAAYI